MSSPKPTNNSSSDTGQNRTVSWVSSLSATTASEAILGNGNNSLSEPSSIQQRVRLTTINPITDSFEVPDGSASSNDLDPGKVLHQTFRGPPLVHLAQTKWRLAFYSAYFFWFKHVGEVGLP